MTAAPRFGSVVTAMVTPFDADGVLDADGAASLARWLADHGTDALVLAGSTGEGAMLDDTELYELTRAVTEAVTIPVIAATGTADTRHTIERTKLVERAGADAALVVTPYYVRPSQTGLAAHFEAVALSTPLPVLIYDIPIRSGRRVATDTLVRLAHELGNLVGVKDAAGDPVGTARLVADAPASFDVYCGDDLLTLPTLAVGAVGVVSVAAHWIGPQISEIVKRFAKGDTEGARETNARHLEQMAFQSSDEYPNPLPAKAVCRALGHAVGQCRLPIGPAPAELDLKAAQMLSTVSA
jgi:4-hydroxy-tetrahydrodipicolinate synthase